MSEEQDILSKLHIQDISEKNANKYYKFAIYGKFGTGKTTFLTKDKTHLF